MELLKKLCRSFTGPSLSGKDTLYKAAMYGSGGFTGRP